MNVSWLPATRRNGDNLNGDKCGHSGVRLSQNGEKATSQHDDNESLLISLVSCERRVHDLQSTSTPWNVLECRPRYETAAT